MTGRIIWVDERGEDELVAAAETAAECAVHGLWPGADASLSHISGGLTNHNFQVDVAHERYFLQIQGEDTTAASLGIDRTGQVALARRAHALGLGPEVVHAGRLDGPRVLVTRFLEGQSLAEKASGLDDAEVLSAIGSRLRLLHDSPALETAYSWAADPFGSIRQFAESLLSNPDVDAETQSFVAWSDELVGAVSAIRGPWQAVPAHCDLVPGNIIADGERLYFVDWEYSGMGDGLFDIADCCAKSELTDEQADALLQGWGSRAEHDACIVAAYAPISMVREGLWGLVARDLGWRSDLDYGDYARERFASARGFVDERGCLEPCAHRTA